ncbi:MAG: AAA family ATPase [Rhodopila sp.]
MIVWSLISQKGGAGKTTLAIHLAMEAAIRGAKTLLVDLDPQSSASKWGDRRQSPSIDVDVMSAHTPRLEAVLKEAADDGYAVVILDTAPHADSAALVSARQSRLILVPCRPSILDLDAIGMTLDMAALAKRPCQVVLNAAPIRSRVTQQARGVVAKEGHVVADPVIHERVAFRHALVDGRVAQEFEPGGAAATEIADLFSALACQDDDMLAFHHAREIA